MNIAFFQPAALSSSVPFREECLCVGRHLVTSCSTARCSFWKNHITPAVLRRTKRASLPQASIAFKAALPYPDPLYKSGGGVIEMMCASKSDFSFD